MPNEIERKFLVNRELLEFALRNAGVGQGDEMVQGYLSSAIDATVRVRTTKNKDSGETQGYLTVKGKTEGISRKEFEYNIPYDEASDMMSMCERSLSKTRRYVEYCGHLFEIDFFHGNLEGLVVCEVELESADEELETPSWCIEEVSDKPKYFNSNLALMKFVPENF
jgi:adenylate cyclase